MLNLFLSLTLSIHLRREVNPIVCTDPFCGFREGYDLFWKLFNPMKAIRTKSCPKITPLLKLDLDRYLNGSWYVQMQQVNDYQPKNKLYCVQADYLKRQDELIDIVNSASLNAVNGSFTRSKGICAKQVNDKIEGLLAIGSCRIFNLGLDYFAGPYWIIDYRPRSDNERELEWAIVLGGVPTLKDLDGTCTTPLKGINEAGLWLLTRNRQPRPKLLKEMISSLKEKGITTKYLLPVKQKGCLSQ